MSIEHLICVLRDIFVLKEVGIASFQTFWVGRSVVTVILSPGRTIFYFFSSLDDRL
jgi:hypothetical protein